MPIANRGIVSRQIDRLFREGSLVGLGDSQLLERYLTRRDEAAFEALINMHGPMVLALCRRILRDPRDVEDAFQATFLVLVRKASAIRDRGLLSNWLYGVAFRVATRARSNTMRRRGRELTVANLEVAADAEAPDCLGIGPALDEELSRLPGKFRAPLVLCYLKGQTHDQAAEELRCPVGTVRSRLSRGRDLLRRRLTRRGFAPTAAVLGSGSGLPAQLLTEAVPPSLIAATVEAAFASSTFTTIQAGAVTASVLALTQGVLTSMKIAQLKWIGLAVVTTSLSVGGAVAISHARPQSARVGGDPDPSAVSVTASQGASTPQPRGQASRATAIAEPADVREQEIERKIDRLLQDIGFFASDGSDGRPATDGSLAAKVLQRKLGQLFGSSNATSSTIGGTVGTSVSNSRTSARTEPTSTGTASTSPFSSQTSSAPSPTVAASTSPFTSQTSSARSTVADSTSTLAVDPDPRHIPNDPDDETRALNQPDLDPRFKGDTTHRSIRELEVELKLALEESDRIESLYRVHAVSSQQREAARGKVLMTTATLEGLYDELVEQNERFSLEFKRKRAELAQVQARRDGAASIVARNHRLNERRPGIVGEEDVAKAEAELKGAEAQVQIKTVEIEEVELRREQLQHRGVRIKQVLALAERVKTTGIGAPAATGGVAAPAVSASGAGMR